MLTKLSDKALSAYVVMQTASRPALRRPGASRGQTVLEWVLIAVAVSVFLFFAYRLLAEDIEDWLKRIGDQIDSSEPKTS